MLIIAYMPANNQIFADGETAVGFVGLLVLWLLTRRRLEERALPVIRTLPVSSRPHVLGSDPLRPSSEPVPGDRVHPGRPARWSRNPRMLLLGALCCLAGAAVGVWLRPEAAQPSAQARLILNDSRGESALQRTGEADLVARVARLPSVVSEARATPPPGPRAPGCQRTGNHERHIRR